MYRICDEDGEATVYGLGFDRGYARYRPEPTDCDWDWLGNMTDGVIQGTDPNDALLFANGMRDGYEAAVAEERKAS